MSRSQVSPATELVTIRAAGIAGLLFAGLLTFSLGLMRANPLGDLNDPTTGIVRVADTWLLALYLIPFAGIAFLWFIAVLRRRIGAGEDQFFATVFLGSGFLFIAMLFAAGAAATAAVTAARATDAPATEPAFVLGRSLADALFYVFAVKMAAVFMLVSSNIARRRAFLPRWLVGFGVIAALVMLLSVGFFEPIALGFPIWVVLVSLLLIRADPRTWSDD